MGKILIISESQLKFLTHSIIEEQSVVGAANYGTTSSYDPNQKTQGDIEIENAVRKHPCINRNFVAPYTFLLEKKKYNELILKTALGIIGRESHYASGTRYSTYGYAKEFLTLFGVDVSSGPAQMRVQTAKQLGINRDYLQSNLGALDAAYRYLIRSYNKAKQVGYNSGQPSNVENGTGNGTLDIAIASYNIGPDNITKWCRTNDKNINAPCDSPNGKYQPYPKDRKDYFLNVLTNQPILNYVPNRSTDKGYEGIHTKTHGYVQTVALELKKLNC